MALTLLLRRRILLKPLIDGGVDLFHQLLFLVAEPLGGHARWPDRGQRLVVNSVVLVMYSSWTFWLTSAGVSPVETM